MHSLSNSGHSSAQHQLVGSLRIDAPFGSSRRTRGSYGEMRQWIGDGHRMFSLVVAFRDEAESTMGLRGRLAMEVARVGSTYESDADSGEPRQQVAYVPGSRAAFMSVINGVRDGVGVHNLVLMAAGHTQTHFVHIATPDHDEGRDLAAAVSTSLRLVG